jgi:hypothetical protein
MLSYNIKVVKVSLRYLSHQAIDLGKWDQCIAGANNGSVYAYSSLLNHMSPGWDALIQGDYEAVMPLTWKRKMMISYLYQPAFLAEGGVFSSDAIAKDDLEAFLHAIPAHFRLWEFSLNSGNPLKTDQHNLAQRANYLLPLDKAYQAIRSDYKDNLERNLAKARKEGLQYTNEVSASEVITLAQKQLEKLTNLKREDFQRFSQLCDALAPPRTEPTREARKVSVLGTRTESAQEARTAPTQGPPFALARGVLNQDNQLLASAIFLFSHGKAYYALVGNAPEGRSTGASHLLLDRFIYEFAGAPITLDFEGSDIPSLERFYQAFGANKIIYPAVRLNRLPWPVKWLK